MERTFYFQIVIYDALLKLEDQSYHRIFMNSKREFYALLIHYISCHFFKKNLFHLEVFYVINNRNLNLPLLLNDCQNIHFSVILCDKNLCSK